MAKYYLNYWLRLGTGIHYKWRWLPEQTLFIWGENHFPPVSMLRILAKRNWPAPPTIYI